MALYGDWLIHAPGKFNQWVHSSIFTVSKVRVRVRVKSSIFTVFKVRVSTQP